MEIPCCIVKYVCYTIKCHDFIFLAIMLVLDSHVVVKFLSAR